MNEILPAVGKELLLFNAGKMMNLLKYNKKINDNETSLCAIAERKMLQTIGGDCETA